MHRLLHSDLFQSTEVVYEPLTALSCKPYMPLYHFIAKDSTYFCPENKFFSKKTAVRAFSTPGQPEKTFLQMDGKYLPHT
jgi:hypothetical protein